MGASICLSIMFAILFLQWGLYPLIPAWWVTVPYVIYIGYEVLYVLLVSQAETNKKLQWLISLKERESKRDFNYLQRRTR